MKTVSGEIVSLTPVSVSRAASILSNFVSADTGASHAVNAYLRRSTSAFDDLVRLHSKSQSKKRKPREAAEDQRRDDLSEEQPRRKKKKMMR
ncbi:hypothetical protein LINPERHAP2_LOCUS14811 [Linum perenne]